MRWILWKLLLAQKTFQMMWSTWVHFVKFSNHFNWCDQNKFMLRMFQTIMSTNDFIEMNSIKMSSFCEFSNQLSKYWDEFSENYFWLNTHFKWCNQNEFMLWMFQTIMSTNDFMLWMLQTIMSTNEFMLWMCFKHDNLIRWIPLLNNFQTHSQKLLWNTL